MLIYYFYFILVFVVGLCVGSFINVIIFRLDKKSGILNGRSECPKCKTQLKWYDLVPVFSFIMLRGKCRYCRKKISYVYPFVEILTGLIFVIFFIFNPEMGYIGILNLFLIILFVILLLIDYLRFIIPNKILIIILALTLIINLVFKRGEILSLFITALISAAFFGIIYIASKGSWIGLGDVKLGFVLGFLFGYPFTLLIIVFSIWAGAVVGLSLIVFKKASMQTALPLGAFLSLFSIIYLIFQNETQIFKTLF